MKTFQQSIQVTTQGRGTYNISPEIRRLIQESGITTGLCHIFCQHTSASLILCENADPSVRRDLEMFMARLVPDGDPMYDHSLEGPDDMPAHIRSILTNMDLTIPVSRGEAALGTWQGVFLWEHRSHSQRRHVTITLQGD
ncbi:MAG: secondary thiamine-phosphate synthase [Sedimenticola sp.]|jgi:secondary thiamine-phosphate synthase enzyme|nr:MAG: secondary thiamine-phosphate synthase [Sedimenticola sp.]